LHIKKLAYEKRKTMPLNIKLLNLAYGIKKKNFVDFDFAGRHLEKMVTQNFRENTVISKVKGNRRNKLQAFKLQSIFMKSRFYYEVNPLLQSNLRNILNDI